MHTDFQKGSHREKCEYYTGRSDLLAFDDYMNVVFVVEFKKPTEIDLEQDFAQLWERYVKPLKARYGLLTDGLELLIYERINSNWEIKLRVNLGEVILYALNNLKFIPHERS